MKNRWTSPTFLVLALTGVWLVGGCAAATPMRGAQGKVSNDRRTAGEQIPEGANPGNPGTSNSTAGNNGGIVSEGGAPDNFSGPVDVGNTGTNSGTNSNGWNGVIGAVGGAIAGVITTAGSQAGTNNPVSTNPSTNSTASSGTIVQPPVKPTVNPSSQPQHPVQPTPQWTAQPTPQPTPQPTVNSPTETLYLDIRDYKEDAWWKNCLTVLVYGQGFAHSYFVGCNKGTRPPDKTLLASSRPACNRVDLRMDTYSLTAAGNQECQVQRANGITACTSTQYESNPFQTRFSSTGSAAYRISATGSGFHVDYEDQPNPVQGGNGVDWNDFSFDFYGQNVSFWIDNGSGRGCQ